MRERNWYGVTIQVRRGTKAQLDGITLAAGELGFTTDDQKELWVGDGASNLLVGRVIMDTIGNQPSAAVAGRMFYATDTDELFVDNGATWDEILSDISGTQNNLIKIDANGKPEDAGVAVSDAGTTTSYLWTASKIQTAINAAVSGISWKEPVDVLNLIGNAAASVIEVLSNTGDAYIVTTADGVGELAVAAVGDVWEYSGAAWVKIATGAGGFVADGVRAALAPDTGTALISPYTDNTDNSKVLDFDGTSLTGVASGDSVEGNAMMVQEGYYDNNQYAFDGTVPTGSWVLINQGGGLTAGNGIDITTNIVSAVSDVTTGGNVVPIDVTANGIGLDLEDIDGTGIEVDSATLRLAAQGNGIAGSAGSSLSVDSDTETGGDIQGANVTANGVGLDISAIAGIGIEADGSANLRLATQGNGIAGGAGSTLSVNPDSTTGGNVIPVDVTANGVGLDVDDLDGTGLEVDSAKLRLAAQGNGIAGGAGSTLSVDPDDTTGATVCPVTVGANGVGTTIDNSSITHAAGTLSVAAIDGGSF